MRSVTRNGTIRHFQVDEGTRVRLAWLQWAMINWLGADDVTHSTVLRYAVALAVDHVEKHVRTASTGDGANTLELYRIACANAGRDLGVTPEQARTLPVLPFSVIRDAVKQRPKATEGSNAAARA